jgi:hypothetical protein
MAMTAEEKKVKERQKKWREKNPDYSKKSSKEWKEKNPEKVQDYNKEYNKNNRDKINKNRQKKIKNDNIYKLTENIRASITSSLKNKGYTKKTKTFNILGCSYEDFKIHLEKQFESWMNWENKGNPKDGKFEPNKTWDIDHIIPLSSAKTEEELIKLNHYTNLRPLCSYYNRFVKRHHLEEDLKKDLVDNL